LPASAAYAGHDPDGETDPPDGVSEARGVGGNSSVGEVSVTVGVGDAVCLSVGAASVTVVGSGSSSATPLQPATRVATASPPARRRDRRDRQRV